MTEELAARDPAPKRKELNLSLILRDIRIHLYEILCVAIAAGLLAAVFFARNNKPTYTAQMTYVVTRAGTNNTVYENLSSASETANTLSQIASSSQFRSIIVKNTGGDVRGSISGEYVEYTNLFILRVKASTPMDAYNTILKVMDNNQVFLDYLAKDVRLGVLVSPSVPTEPDEQYSVGTRALYVGLGVLAALFVLTGVISWRKDTVQKGSDVEKRLHTHLLGTICHENKYKTFRARIEQKHMSMLITRPTVSFPYAEGYHKAARRVINFMKVRDAKSLLITSVNENEGKSTAAANLALAMAAGGKKVLLVDLDLRKPSLYKVFDVEDDVAIEELGALLCGEPVHGSPIRMLSEEKLYVIFNTVAYSQSAEILSNGRLKMMLDYLCDQFDYILLDTPPMNVVADAEVIAGFADASMMVVREHQTAAPAIQAALDALRDSHARPVGCLINDAYGSVSEGVGGYQYGYDYGYRYDKGYGRYYGRYDKT